MFDFLLQELKQSCLYSSLHFVFLFFPVTLLLSLFAMWLAMLGTSLERFFPQLTHPLHTGSHFSIPVPWQDTLPVPLQTDGDVACVGIKE